MKKYIKSEYILAMAVPRKVALKRLSSDAEALKDHVIKCVLYSDIRQDDIYHWIHDEICSWLERASSVKSDSKLKQRDYLNTLFSEFGSDLSDARWALQEFKKEYCIKSANPYPDFQITDDIVTDTYIAFQSLVKICVPLLTSKDMVDQETWYKLIHKILE